MSCTVKVEHDGDIGEVMHGYGAFGVVLRHDGDNTTGSVFGVGLTARDIVKAIVLMLHAAEDATGMSCNDIAVKALAAIELGAVDGNEVQ